MMDAEQPDEALFIDTNVLIYANVEEAPLHQIALAKIARARDEGRPLWLSWQVLREYLAIMTRPQSFQAVPRDVVLEQVRIFSKMFGIADDNLAVSERLLTLMEEISFGGKQVHDANIVATMLANNIPVLLTHNIKDFERFSPQIRIEQLV